MYHKGFVAALRAGGKFLREKDSKVFLPYGSDYAIRLRNYHPRKAVVEITIDGKNISPGSRFIIPENGTVDIERFLEGNQQEGHKFKFIQMTDRIREHRGETIDDGIVRVEYWFEQEPIKWISTTSWYSPQWTYTDFNTISGPSDLPTYTRGLSSNGMHVNSSHSVYCSASLPPEDAGITVNGGISDQKFSSSTTGILETTSHVIVFKLTGDVGNSVVVKPVVRQTKAHCTVCGTSNPFLNEYCGHCGNNLH
jgi:hypothetical protein